MISSEVHSIVAGKHLLICSSFALESAKIASFGLQPVQGLQKCGESDDFTIRYAAIVQSVDDPRADREASTQIEIA